MVAVIEGAPAEVLDPKIPTQNSVSVMELLDFEVHLLLMFLDVDMPTSKQLVRDKSGTLCWLQDPPLASNVLHSRNEIHVHISIERLHRLD